jgi:hypothetical protein
MTAQPRASCAGQNALFRGVLTVGRSLRAPSPGGSDGHYTGTGRTAYPVNSPNPGQRLARMSSVARSRPSRSRTTSTRSQNWA